MKNLVMISVLFGSFMVSSTSHALVRLMATCQTTDNMYRVSIFDNEGIGPDRTPNYGAAIYSADGKMIDGYAVTSNIGQPRSISFGQLEYRDSQTNGEKFLLAFGSTNYRHITLQFMLNNGAKVSELDPTCKTY